MVSLERPTEDVRLFKQLTKTGRESVFLTENKQLVFVQRGLHRKKFLTSNEAKTLRNPSDRLNLGHYVVNLSARGVYGSYQRRRLREKGNSALRTITTEHC